MAEIGRTYEGVKIIAIIGDITKQEVDAIVNPANSWMIMGGGVAGAIKRAGGKEVEDEAVKHALVPVGKAIATGAGKLKAKYVIHAPTMERPAMRISVENVRLAVRAALKCADELKLKSVAFPGMGTGVGGLALDEAAEAMIDETKKYVEKGTHLDRIVFVGFNQDLTQAFLIAINEAFVIA